MPASLKRHAYWSGYEVSPIIHLARQVAPAMYCLLVSIGQDLLDCCKMYLVKFYFTTILLLIMNHCKHDTACTHGFDCRAQVDELAEAYLQKKSKGMEDASSSRAGLEGSRQEGPALDRPQCGWRRQVLIKRDLTKPHVAYLTIYSSSPSKRMIVYTCGGHVIH